MMICFRHLINGLNAVVCKLNRIVFAIVGGRWVFVCTKIARMEELHGEISLYLKMEG